jgi:hypothetical protein
MATAVASGSTTDIMDMITNAPSPQRTTFMRGPYGAIALAGQSIGGDDGIPPHLETSRIMGV